MNKVSQRYGHTRVRWQSGLIRVHTEEGVQTKIYTSTDGKDPAETLRLWMNTYKDKLADENAAYIESLSSKAVSKPGGDQQPQRETQDNPKQEKANDKEEEVNTGIGSEDTLKAGGTPMGL